MPTTPTPADWLRVKAEVEKAAAEVTAWHPRLLSVLQSAGQEHHLSSVVHAQIVDRLIRSGIGQRKGAGNHDIELFGLPGEVKTTSGITFVGNKSTSRLVNDVRLLVAVNWTVINGKAVNAWLIRVGEMRASDLCGAGGDTVQFAVIPTHNLFAIGPDPERWPPMVSGKTLVPGIGPAALAKLGSPGTIAELRRAVERDGSMAERKAVAAFASPAKLAERVGWGGRRIG